MKKRPVHLTRRERLSNLRAFITLCFVIIEEGDWKEVANRTGLCVSTIRRLACGEATLACRWNTIEAMGLAAGIRLVNGREVSLRQARKLTT